MSGWWHALGGERYWMEITDRDDVGADLLAPKLDDAGKPYWGYNLVTDVRAGDIVFHWHKTMYALPGIIGWSTATGVVEDTTITWQSRGAGERRRGPSEEEPAWRMPLVDFTWLSEPIDQDVIRQSEKDLLRVRDQLAGTHGGSLYFPFAFSSARPVRVWQGYLVKVPAAVLDLFEDLGNVPRSNRPALPPAAPPIAPDARGAGYIADAKLRRALERQGVAQATSYYQELEYEVKDVGATESFDLLVLGHGECRHVEVKASSLQAATVELTKGEVENARRHQPTDLFVVSNVPWRREPDDSITTQMGDEKVFHDWIPEPAALEAIRFRYEVPASDESDDA